MREVPGSIPGTALIVLCVVLCACPVVAHTCRTPALAGRRRRWQVEAWRGVGILQTATQRALMVSAGTDVVARRDTGRMRHLA